MEKNCSKCGRTFNCQSEARGCWCESMQLSKETLAYLKDTYANCLCPDCLKTFTAGVPAVPVADESYSETGIKKEPVASVPQNSKDRNGFSATHNERA